MNKIKKFVDIVYEQLTKKDWDGVYAIVADEGFGKSNLGLHMTEMWYKKLKGKITTKDVKHVNLDPKEWLEDLRDLKTFECTVYDEAGDLNTKGALSRFNKDMDRIFETFRQFGIVVIFCLPLFKSLDNNLMDKGLMRWLLHTYGRTETYGNPTQWCQNLSRQHFPLPPRH